MISHSQQPTLSKSNGNPNQPMSVTSTTSLIRYVEIWQVGADAQSEPQKLSACVACAFADEEVRSIDCSGKKVDAGEGIAGSAWKQNATVVIQDRESTILKEASEKSGLELTAVVAVPFVNDRHSVTIVVFGLSDGFGGLEVWSRDDRDELSISGSYYEGLDSFEFISQYVRFPRGSGLPGNSWKSRRPRMVKDPGVDANFIRSFAKDPADLSACVGIPVTCEYGSDGAVLLLLSATQQPIARQIDILRCESATPNEHDGFPPVKLIGHESTALVTEEAAFARRAQATCDRLAQTRNVMWLAADDHCVPEDAQASLLVPFFDKHQIRSVLQLSF